MQGRKTSVWTSKDTLKFTAPDSLGQSTGCAYCKGYKPEKEEPIWKAKESMPITDLGQLKK